jgi:hypothetical protein
VTICSGRWYFQTTREISICLIYFERTSGCDRAPEAQTNRRHILTAPSINIAQD